MDLLYAFNMKQIVLNLKWLKVTKCKQKDILATLLECQINFNRTNYQNPKETKFGSVLLTISKKRFNRHQNV